MEQWTTFAQDRWYLIVAAIIVLFFIIRIVKSLIKWVLVIAIAAGLLWYGSHYAGNWKALSQHVMQMTQDQVEKALIDSAKNAKYHQNQDGTYTLTSGSIELEGKIDSTKARLLWRGQYIGTIDIAGELQKILDTYRSQAARET